MNVSSPVRAAAAESKRAFAMSPVIAPGVARALDIVLLAAAGFGGLPVVAATGGFDLELHVSAVVAVIFAYVFVAERARLFSVDALMRPLRRSDDLLMSFVTAYLLFMSLAFGFRIEGWFSLTWQFGFLAAGCVLLPIGRVLLRGVLIQLSGRGVMGHTMAVLGVSEQSRRFLGRFRRANPYFLQISGVFRGPKDPEADVVEGHPVLGDVEDLLTAARAHRIDDVVVAMPWAADQQVIDVIERLKELPVNVHLASDLIGFELAFRPVTGALTELPMFEVVQRPISGWSSVLKLLEDYVISATLLILLSPLMLMIAALVRLDSEGPVFFKQKRLGFNNEEFDIYKFRSMYHGAAQPAGTVTQARKGDPRVTRVGRVIRATSLDELPQLLNVLDGTMSLVGPRPHAVSHNEEYGRQIRGYFARHRVKPGITGWAQVNGFRGETDTLDKMEARIRHDVYYAENWSLLFDIKILLMTAACVLFQKSAY